MDPPGLVLATFWAMSGSGLGLYRAILPPSSFTVLVPPAVLWSPFFTVLVPPAFQTTRGTARGWPKNFQVGPNRPKGVQRCLKVGLKHPGGGFKPFGPLYRKWPISRAMGRPNGPLGLARDLGHFGTWTMAHGPTHGPAYGPWAGPGRAMSWPVGHGPAREMGHFGPARPVGQSLFGPFPFVFSVSR